MGKYQFERNVSLRLLSRYMCTWTVQLSGSCVIVACQWVYLDVYKHFTWCVSCFAQCFVSCFAQCFVSCFAQCFVSSLHLRDFNVHTLDEDNEMCLICIQQLSYTVNISLLAFFLPRRRQRSYIWNKWRHNLVAVICEQSEMQHLFVFDRVPRNDRHIGTICFLKYKQQCFFPSETSTNSPGICANNLSRID